MHEWLYMSSWEEVVSERERRLQQDGVEQSRVLAVRSLGPPRVCFFGRACSDAGDA